MNSGTLYNDFVDLNNFLPKLLCNEFFCGTEMFENRDLVSDNRGDILGLPMDMLIISIIMLISIPLIFSYSSMYIQRQIESDLRIELDKLVNTFEEIVEAEQGNRRTFSLNFNDHPLARLSYVRLGGDSHHLRTTIRYRFRDRPEVVMSLDGLVVSAIEGEEFVSVDIPLDGSTVLIESSNNERMDFVQLSVGE